MFRVALIFLFALLLCQHASTQGTAPGTATTTAAGQQQPATLTLMSGQIIDLPQLFKAANNSCCVPRALLGDFTPIVRMDSSRGRFYTTADPSCQTAAIESVAYPAMFEAINMCGTCGGGRCPSVDGGLFVALPGDWCVDANNTADPTIVCSTQQPVCDAGFSGRCIALPEASMKAIPAADGPSMTLQSGQVVSFRELAKLWPGECCLPRTIIIDFTPIIRLDNSDGKVFVSNDPSCGTPITSNFYPAMFEYVYVCPDTCPPGGCLDKAADPVSADITITVDGGVTLVQSGGTCDPFDYWATACWGAAPWCSFAGVCMGIPYYDDVFIDIDYGWGPDWNFWRPIWWRPLPPIFRPPWWKPPVVIVPRPPVWRPIWPSPPGWKPGKPGFPGWRPGDRPPSWRPPPPSWKPPPGHRPGWPTTLPAKVPNIKPGGPGNGWWNGNPSLKPPTTLPSPVKPGKPVTLPGNVRPVGPGVNPIRPPSTKPTPLPGVVGPGKPETKPAPLPDRPPGAGSGGATTLPDKLPGTGSGGATTLPARPPGTGSGGATTLPDKLPGTGSGGATTLPARPPGTGSGGATTLPDKLPGTGSGGATTLPGDAGSGAVTLPAVRPTVPGGGGATQLPDRPSGPSAVPGGGGNRPTTLPAQPGGGGDSTSTTRPSVTRPTAPQRPTTPSTNRPVASESGRPPTSMPSVTRPAPQPRPVPAPARPATRPTPTPVRPPATSTMRPSGGSSPGRGSSSAAPWPTSSGSSRPGGAGSRPTGYGGGSTRGGRGGRNLLSS